MCAYKVLGEHVYKRRGPSIEDLKILCAIDAPYSKIARFSKKEPPPPRKIPKLKIKKGSVSTALSV